MNWININEASRPYNGQQVLVKFGVLNWSVAVYDRDADAFMQPYFGQTELYAYENVTAWASVEL